MWYPYVEWSFQNPGWTGNPFDIQAQATFSDGRTPGLFYDGGDTWKLRYLCTQEGTFTFTTASSESALNDISGSVQCQPNPGAMGLLVPAGPDNKKFYVTGWEKAITPAWAMIPSTDNNAGAEKVTMSTIDTWIANNIVQEGFMGAHSYGPANVWYDWDCDGTRSNCTSENPDPRTFQEYEAIMDKLYQQNAFLHIWMFWDCARDRCDKYHDDTVRQERLRRYPADRWGAIPNWMIGEGFDNFEDDTTGGYANKWFNDINDRLAWHHFLG